VLLHTDCLTALKISICIIETCHWKQTVNIYINLVSSQTIYMEADSVNNCKGLVQSRCSWALDVRAVAGKRVCTDWLSVGNGIEYRDALILGFICVSGPGCLIRYSDSLRAGRSGHRGEIFRTCPDRPWGLRRPLYNGYWVFPVG